MVIDYFKTLRGTVGQWLECRFRTPRSLLFAACHSLGPAQPLKALSPHL